MSQKKGDQRSMLPDSARGYPQQQEPWNGYQHNEMTEKELRTLSREIGFEWEKVGMFLNFKHEQIEQLKMMYPHQVQGCIFTMLQKWHDVVAADFGEDPRLLLASVFIELKNQQLASKIVSRDLLDVASRYQIKSSTAAAIQRISFDIVPPHQMSGVLNTGAPGAINMFDGELNFGGSVCVDGSGGTFPTQQSFSSSDLSSLWTDGRRSNVGASAAINVFGGRVNTGPNSHIKIGQGPVVQQVRVEDADQSDVRFCSDNKYKKSTDDTLSETVTNAFAEHMKSVGALVYSNGIGTVFRVGSKYVMTAWHVVDNIVDPSRKGDQDYSKLEESTVFIIFDEDPMQCTSKYYVKKNPAFIDKMLDISVLEINSVNNQPNLPKRLHLRKEGPIEERNISDISLVGYGHPGSYKKHLDPKCRVISQLSYSAVPAALGWLKKYRDYYVDALKSAGKDHSLVDTAYTGYDVQSKLLLNCYMEHGASGAPTFTTVDPTALNVVGVLTNGLPEFFFYLPKVVQISFPPERRFEMAARMTHIYKSMCEKNAALAKDLFETG